MHRLVQRASCNTHITNILKYLKSGKENRQNVQYFVIFLIFTISFLSVIGMLVCMPRETSVILNQPDVLGDQLAPLVNYVSEGLNTESGLPNLRGFRPIVPVSAVTRQWVKIEDHPALVKVKDILRPFYEISHGSERPLLSSVELIYVNPNSPEPFAIEHHAETVGILCVAGVGTHTIRSDSLHQRNFECSRGGLLIGSNIKPILSEPTDYGLFALMGFIASNPALAEV